MHALFLGLAILSAFLIGQECGCEDVDEDGDGWTRCDGDCDDTDASIHPGAQELCDGVDNDCDREVDSGIVGGDPLCAALSCLEVLEADPEAESGSFWIEPEGSEAPFEAQCDMNTQGGGWTLCFLNRTLEDTREVQYPTSADDEDYDFCPFDGSRSYLVRYVRDGGEVSFLIDSPLSDPTESASADTITLLSASLETSYSSSRTTEDTPDWANMTGFSFYQNDNVAGDSASVRTSLLQMHYWYNDGDFRIGPDLYDAYSEDADYTSAGGCSGSSPESEHIHQGYLASGVVMMDGLWERYESGCGNGYLAFVTGTYAVYDNYFYYR